MLGVFNERALQNTGGFFRTKKTSKTGPSRAFSAQEDAWMRVLWLDTRLLFDLYHSLCTNVHSRFVPLTRAPGSICTSLPWMSSTPVFYLICSIHSELRSKPDLHSLLHLECHFMSTSHAHKDTHTDIDTHTVTHRHTHTHQWDHFMSTSNLDLIDLLWTDRGKRDLENEIPDWDLSPDKWHFRCNRHMQFHRIGLFSTECGKRDLEN